MVKLNRKFNHCAKEDRDYSGLGPQGYSLYPPLGLSEAQEWKNKNIMFNCLQNYMQR